MTDAAARAREAHEGAFSFVLKISGRDRLGPYDMDALYEAGCDDCLIVEMNGQVLLDFDRCAPTRGEAIASAMTAVRGAGFSVSIADDGAMHDAAPPLPPEDGS